MLLPAHSTMVTGIHRALAMPPHTADVLWETAEPSLLWSQFNFIYFPALNSVIKTNRRPPHTSIVSDPKQGWEGSSEGRGASDQGWRPGSCYHFAKLQGIWTKETRALKVPRQALLKSDGIRRKMKLLRAWPSIYYPWQPPQHNAITFISRLKKENMGQWLYLISLIGS